MIKLHRLATGKIGESLVLAKLLSCGLEVYEPVVDDRGIDFVVRFPGGSFLEVQVKKVGTDRDPEWFLLQTTEDIEYLKKRPYFVVGVTYTDEFWVFPPEVFFDELFANISTNEKGITTVDLNLATTKRENNKTNRERLSHLKDNWELLVERSRTSNNAGGMGQQKC